MSNDRFIATELRQKVQDCAKTPAARLIGLSILLNDWDKESSSAKESTKELKKLSIRDIDLLKEIIHSEVQKTSVNNPDVISDQLFFLFLGAIQLQKKNNAEATWQLVQQSIQNFLSPKKNNGYVWAGAVATCILVACFATALYLKSNISEIATVVGIAEEPSKSMPVDVVGPASLGVLLGIYNQMKGGACQLPQAGMLPPEQRHAYLAFINDGIIDVNEVDNLKLALRYVTCLYPQKLMYAPL